MVFQSANAGDHFKFSAEYGPYAVGFKVVKQYDPSRIYRGGVDAITGEAVQDTHGRPIQTLIWYPAASPGRSLKYDDYINLGASEDRFDLDAMQSKRVIQIQLRGNITLSASDIEDMLGEAVHATGDALPVSGRFPLIVYAPSDSSSAFENDALCEYLASHGYVVIASPSLGAHTRYMTYGNIPGDLENTRAQAADIGFLIGYASSIPDVDSAKIGVLGYSWGGMASTFAAVTDNRIRALAYLDGSVRYYPKLLAAAPEVTPDRIDVPVLFFANKDDPLEPGRDSKPNSFITRIHHADVTEIGLKGLSHDDLNSQSLRVWSGNDQSESAAAGRNESYAWMARYTLAFFDDTLKDLASAKTFMHSSPDMNHVPPGYLVMQHRTSIGPASSITLFAQMLAKNGFDKAVETYASFRKTYPEFHMTEDDFDSWSSSLWSLGRPDEAIGLCKLRIHIFPKSTDAWLSLAYAFNVDNRLNESVQSYRHVLALDPHNKFAAEQVRRLLISRAR